MEIKNNKEEIPFEHYLQRVQQLDPEDAVRRLEIPFEGGAFTVPFLHETYRITWPDYTISGDGPNAFALRKRQAQTFLLRYLLLGKNLPATGAWKTFRQLPWGEVYIQPFNGRCIQRSAFTFGRDLNKFAAASRKLGGVEISQGNAGFEFNVIQDYRIRISVWEAAEEFAPNAQILFSDNFAAGFLAEDSVTAAELLISAVSAAMTEQEK